MRKFKKFVCVMGLLFFMVIGARAAHAAVIQQLPVSNPGFETLTVTNGISSPKDWKTWWWSGPVNNPSISAASYTENEKNGGQRSVFIDSVSTGYAGWVSNPITLPSEMMSFRISAKLKTSQDYSGNKPRFWVSFQNNGTFLGSYTTDQTEGVSLGDWTEVSFTVDRSQFPAGTNTLVLNLSTTSINSATPVSGKIYYDDVMVEASEEPIPVIQHLPVSNPSFETLTVTNGVSGPKDWKTWWWNGSANNPPVSAANYTENEKSSGLRSVFIGSVSSGYAGWVSSPITLPSNMTSFRITAKLKASPDYSGNKPRFWVSFQNNGTFLGSYTTDKTDGLSIADWTEVSFTVDRSQFPAGTNTLVLNLTTTSINAATPASGKLYYDDVKAEASNQSLGPVVFTLKSNKFASWWNLGDPVVYQLNAGAVASSINTIIGSVYNSDNELVAQVPVSRQTFLDTGWSWTPSEPGYYEVAFTYQQNGSTDLTDLSVKYTYSQTDLTTFTRERYSLVVSQGPTKPVSQRWPTMGFSYQLSEGENAMKLADLVGFRFARIHAVPWGSQFRDTSWAIEPSRGVYEWSRFDDQINKLSSYGFDMIGNLLYTPQWASPHPEQTQANISVPAYSAYAPVDMKDWEDFVRAVVTRYDTRIKTWEVWNEPNLPGLSVFWLDSTERFVELLKTAYQTIKEEQPDSDVWIGGLAGRNYLSFYKELLSLGGASYFDKLSLHGYLPDPREFQRIDQAFGIASKQWADSESHAILVNSNSVTGTVPTESEIAKRMIVDFLSQLKWGTQKIALFHMLNLSEMETLSYAKSTGTVTHASGLFRSKPRVEPRLAASVAHHFLDLAGQSLIYKGEYVLEGGQKAVVLDNDGARLIGLWSDASSEAPIDSRLAAAFTDETLVTDWEGKVQSANNLLSVHPGKVYWISNADSAALALLPISEPFLISDFDRNTTQIDVPESKGTSGELFNPATLEVADHAVWTTDNWAYKAAAQSTKPADFDASFAAGYSESGLDLIVRVKDGTFVQDNPLGSYWKGDSVQFAIDTFGQGFTGDQVEFQAALTPQGPVLYKQSVPYVGGNLPTNWTPGNSVAQYASLKIDQTVPNETTYYIHVNSSELYPYVHDPKSPLRLSVLVNDNNGSGRLGWLEWSSGIGGDKNPAKYGEVWMLNGLVVEAAQTNMAEGETQTLSAHGLTANGFIDVSGKAVWHSSDPSSVTVDTYGTVKAIGEGNAVIQASYGPFVGSIAITVTADKAPPLTSAAVSPGQPDGQNGWYVSPVTVSLSAVDNLSEVAKTEYSLDGGITWQLYSALVTFEQDGNYTLSYRSTNHAGNEEVAKTISFKIDKTAPTATFAYSQVTPTTQEVVATMTPSEPVTITNNGGSSSYTFYFNSSSSFEIVDAAGNHGTVMAIVNNIVSKSRAIPGMPILADDNGYDTGLQDGNYNVTMNMWYGGNGRIYKLYENDVLIDTKILTDNSPNAQTVVTAVYANKNGTYRYFAELTNAFGTTTSSTHVVTVTKAAPNKPVLSNDNWDADGNFKVSMNMWWGTNGGVYHLYENGVLIYTQALTNNTPYAQAEVTTVTNKAIGTYQYRGELVNYAGATSSDTMIVKVTK
ncbi:OmpL47-type beta-barrel domain-containing protein [Paenibacillus plantarum]|nr:Ig-like domain-containing protein [Paenibacillus plantarum]